jgi:hypothetical protein
MDGVTRRLDLQRQRDAAHASKFDLDALCDTRGKAYVLSIDLTSASAFKTNIACPLASVDVCIAMARLFVVRLTVTSSIGLGERSRPARRPTHGNHPRRPRIIG